MSACPQLHGHRPSGPLPSEPGPGQESPSAGLPASSPAVPSTCSFRHSQSKLGKMQTLREHPQFSGKRPKPPTQPLWSTRASVVTVPSCRPELPPTALSPGHSLHPVLHKGGSVHSVFCPPPPHCLPHASTSSRPQHDEGHRHWSQPPGLVPPSASRGTVGKEFTQPFWVSLPSSLTIGIAAATWDRAAVSTAGKAEQGNPELGTQSCYTCMSNY